MYGEQRREEHYMSDKQRVMENNDLEWRCQKLSDEIEKKKISLWIIEEENSILNDEISFLNETLEAREKRIDELEAWCAHLQRIIDNANVKKPSIIRRILRKIKRILVKCKLYPG